ncbi:MAG: hypothetical protein FJ290_25160 [Planctomycetes bacterium]|nr:hypothetical protein [Planctomycetota bacterium]
MTNQAPMTEGSAYRAVEAAVRGFGAFRKRWAMLEGLAGFIVFGPGCLLVWFLSDWLVGLSPGPLLGTFAAVALISLWAVAWKLVRPTLRRIRVEDEALLIEALHGQIDNQLIASLQLGREAAEATGPLGHSLHLVAALIERTAELLTRLNPRGLLDLRRARRWLGAAAAVAVAALACLVFAGDAVAARAERLADAYAALLDRLFPVELRVTPGDIAVLRGQNTWFHLEVIGGRRRRAQYVQTLLEGPAERRSLVLELELTNGKAACGSECLVPFTYHFVYGRRRTPEYHVRVGDRPQLAAINYELSYPAYTGQPPRTLVGQVAKLQGLNNSPRF